MNIFRALGDLSHLVSIFILIQTIHKTRSAAGLSLKTQLLYLLVFLTRYLDLFLKWSGYYLFFMKLLYIGSSAYICYLMIYKFQSSKREGTIDTFDVRYILGASAVLALIFNLKYSVVEVLWSFSIWLEAGAILPQLFMLQRRGEAETITTHYIAALGAYRALYIPNWIYRWVIADTNLIWFSVLAGIV